MIFAILWVMFVPAFAVLWFMCWLLVLMLRLTWWFAVLVGGGIVFLLTKMVGALRART